MVECIRISAGGFKIAKPGFDVATATDSQLLISNDVKPFRIIVSGNAVVSAGTPLTVYYGFTLTALPLVFMQSSIDNTSIKRLPYYYAGADGRYLRCQRFNNRVVFSSEGGGDRHLYYVVAMGAY